MTLTACPIRPPSKATPPHFFMVNVKNETWRLLVLTDWFVNWRHDVIRMSTKISKIFLKKITNPSFNYSKYKVTKNGNHYFSFSNQKADGWWPAWQLLLKVRVVLVTHDGIHIWPTSVFHLVCLVLLASNMPMKCYCESPQRHKTWHRACSVVVAAEGFSVNACEPSSSFTCCSFWSQSSSSENTLNMLTVDS